MRLPAWGGRFARQSVLTYLALFSWLTPRDYIVAKIAEPVAQIIFFSLVGIYAGEDPAYFALGNAVRLAAVSGLYGCSIMMMEERDSGTLPAIVAAAAPLSETFLARGMLQGLDGVLTSLIGLGVGAWLFGLDFSLVSWPWLITALLITSYAMTGLGTLVSTMGLIGTDLNLGMNAAYTLLLLLCGVNFPLASLPPPLQIAGKLLPLTHGLAAVRLLVEGTFTGVIPLLIREGLIGIGYTAIAFALFRVTEYRARVLGTLDLV